MYSQVDAVKELRKKSAIKAFALLIPILVLDILFGLPIPIFFSISGLILIVVMIRKANFFKMIAIYFSVIIAVYGLYKIRYSMDIYNGNKIVAAIEQYNKKNGVYPEKLEQLTPDFFEEIPKNRTMHRTWFYDLYTKNDYRLTFYTLRIFKMLLLSSGENLALLGLKGDQND